MAWDQNDFLARLRETVERFDRQGASLLCDELIAHVQQGTRLADGIGRKVLATLRRKAYFGSMEKVAEALLFTAQDDAQIRRQYAQALIDQSKLTSAVYVLELLIDRTANDPDENAEARGLLGRVYKQLFINAALADPGTISLEINRGHLQRAVEIYLSVYRSAPATCLWHGINAAALAARAAKDGVPLAGGPDPAALAQEILATLAGRGPREALPAWDLATGAEASLALGDTNGALLWLAQYVQRPDADAFELASTRRQLKDVWRLTVDAMPGALLLPILEAQLLQRQGGRVDLAGGDVKPTIQEIQKTGERVGEIHLEKVLGREGVVTLGWYKIGLDRAQAVAKVLNQVGDGFGTGFLLRGGDLIPSLGDEILLLTNAHVVSSDPAVQKEVGSLEPENATIIFEAFEAAGSQQYKVKDVLFTSPPSELDASLLRLDPPVPACKLFPVAKRLPVADGVQKVYVIGHPGGRTLSISLNDNLLLDWDDWKVHYRAPTEGGSSGSPVFNQQWDLIGLHHAGSTALARLNNKEGTYAANEGIWIQRIIKALKEAGVGAGPPQP